MTLPQPSSVEARADLRPFTLGLMKIELEKALHFHTERLLQTDESDDVSDLIRHRSQRGRDEVLAALSRIEAGAYGYCENCQRPISEERLEAMPHTRLCSNCALDAQRDPLTRIDG